MKTYYAIIVEKPRGFIVKLKAKDFTHAWKRVKKLRYCASIIMEAAKFHNLRKIKPILNEKVEM